MLGLESGRQVIPSSTGVIGWRLPIEPMLEALPAAKQSLQSESIVPVSRFPRYHAATPACPSR